MKKTLAIVLSLVLCIGLLAACGEGDTTTTDPATTEPAATEPAATEPAATDEALSGIVNTDGSTSMNDVMLALIEGFRSVQPDVTVNYNGSGSGSGISGVLAGSFDLGLSSRNLTDDEKAQGGVENVIAKDGIAIVVNPENSVTELTSEQVAQIYTGEITNWSELGGADAAIAVYGRDSASGTRSAFEEILGIEDQCVYTNEYASTGDVIGNVASNPNAIGYASLSAVDESVTALAIDGVVPTEATVADGTFPIQRPFVIVTVEGTELSPAAQAFLDYAMSAEAAPIIESADVVPANA